MDNSMLLTDSKLTELMHDAGVRPSVQRIAVLSYIVNEKSHPTADDIYVALAPKYPSLSRTTVYNSLRTLAEAGIVRELEIESGIKHYDFARQAPHGHFVCRQCGHIVIGKKAPEICPVCKHSRSFFEIEATNY